MTRIICAAYDNRQGLVFVSDRMVSAADGSLNFEYEPKGRMLSYNAMTLESGTMHIPEIISDTQEEITERMKEREMAEVLSKHYILKMN